MLWFDMLLSSGAVAQLGERLLCKQEVVGSLPIGSMLLSLHESNHPSQCGAFDPFNQPDQFDQPG